MKKNKVLFEKTHNKHFLYKHHAIREFVANINLTHSYMYLRGNHPACRSSLTYLQVFSIWLDKYKTIPEYGYLAQLEEILKYKKYLHWEALSEWRCILSDGQWLYAPVEPLSLCRCSCGVEFNTHFQWFIGFTGCYSANRIQGVFKTLQCCTDFKIKSHHAHGRGRIYLKSSSPAVLKCLEDIFRPWSAPS